MVPLPVDQVDVMMPHAVIPVRRGMLAVVMKLHAQANVAEARHIRINPAGNTVIVRPVLMIDREHRAGNALNPDARPFILLRQVCQTCRGGESQRLDAFTIDVFTVERNLGKILFFLKTHAVPIAARKIDG